MSIIMAATGSHFWLQIWHSPWPPRFFILYVLSASSDWTKLKMRRNSSKRRRCVLKTRRKSLRNFRSNSNKSGGGWVGKRGGGGEFLQTPLGGLANRVAPFIFSNSVELPFALALRRSGGIALKQTTKRTLPYPLLRAPY